MRVRVPIDKHSTAGEHQRSILSLYKKFNAKNLRQLNDISEEKEEDEERNETVESQEDDMTDREILGIKKSDHPCFSEVLVEKQTCGMRLKACEHEIYGIPRKHRTDENFSHINFPHFCCFLRVLLARSKAGRLPHAG